MYDWIYDHVINTLFFPGVILVAFLMTPVGLVFSEMLKDKSNK